MADRLSAEEYREGLALVLAELEAMGMPPVDYDEQLEYARRLGGLQASIRGIVRGDRPAISLRTLRQVAQGTPVDE
jgi:hypothetical protein